MKRLETVCEEYTGAKNCKIIETRDDPHVSHITAVRVRFDDKEYNNEMGGDRDHCYLINNYFREVEDEFELDEGQKTLQDIPVGKPRFF